MHILVKFAIEAILLTRLFSGFMAVTNTRNDCLFPITDTFPPGGFEAGDTAS